MNCSKVRETLAIYCELKKNQRDTTALDAHLASCLACRQVLKQYNFIGEGIRSLSVVKPSSRAYTRLMRTLAVEHSLFIQSSSSTRMHTPIPAFLKPYLKAQRSREPQTDSLTTFSSAETGPLSVIRRTRKRPSMLHLDRHLTIVALAAVFLLVMMTGGLTSLLLLAQSHPDTPPINPAPNKILQTSQVLAGSSATKTSYPYIVSAIANSQYIYYTASGGKDTRWMLAQLNNKTKISTPLLLTASSGPLILLGSSQELLVWLQLDPPQLLKNKKSAAREIQTFVRPWRLYTLVLTTDQGAATNATSTPQALLSGTFDQKAVPGWVHTPIQGIWFTQKSLLVASIDKNGISHLTQYPLQSENSKPATRELATANKGHILTSPTATSDATSIYWGEEWLGADNNLHGNIWVQHTVEAARQSGKWAPHTETLQFLFSDDTVSFRPQVVNDTLFLLKSGTTDNSQTTVAASVTPTAAGKANRAMPPLIYRIDPTIYTPQIDASLLGDLYAYSVDNALQLPLRLDTEGPVAVLQGGGRFLIWQNSKGRFDMFDVAANLPVSIEPTMIPRHASFLAVNGDTAVWLADTDVTFDQNTPEGSIVKFKTFNWPSSAPRAQEKTQS